MEQLHAPLLALFQLAVTVWAMYLIAYYAFGERFKYGPGELIGLALRGLVTNTWWCFGKLTLLLTHTLGVLFDVSFGVGRGRHRSRPGRGREVEGAHFLRGLARWRLLRRSKGGLVIDGVRRITQGESFRHLAIVAPTGSGKTTAYVLPNLLSLRPSVSAVVTDPSGEIYERTSGYLASQGFEVKVLNVSDARASLGFNPVERAATLTEIEEVCDVLIEAAYGSPSGEQRFWNTGAKTILSVLVRCLKQQPPEFRNLHNLYHLLNHFGADGRPLYRFVAKNADERAFTEFKGFLGNSDKVIQGMAATARAALQPFADPELCRVTATETLRFEGLRARPTVLYLIVPEHKMRYYGFLLTTFWTQLLAFAMGTERPGLPYLPIYAFLDEFGNVGRIPGFEQAITAVRKRRVSVSIILQDAEQLAATYGRPGAATIVNGGCASRLYLPGLGHETCRDVEQMLGRQTVREDGKERTRSLLSADEVRTLPDDRAIYVFANRHPVLLKMRPYFKSRRLRARAEIPPPPPLPAISPPAEIAYLKLDAERLIPHRDEPRVRRDADGGHRDGVDVGGGVVVDDSGVAVDGDGVVGVVADAGSGVEAEEERGAAPRNRKVKRPAPLLTPVAVLGRAPNDLGAASRRSDSEEPEREETTPTGAYVGGPPHDQPPWADELLRESRRARQEVAGLREAIGVHVVSRKEAARILGKSTKTLQRWEKQGILPRVEVTAPGVHYDFERVLELKRRAS